MVHGKAVFLHGKLMSENKVYDHAQVSCYYVLAYIMYIIHISMCIYYIVVHIRILFYNMFRASEKTTKMLIK
jgi:hypothetical protein